MQGTGVLCLNLGFFAIFLARYRNQTSQAESYYRHAAQLVPSNGESGIPFQFIIPKEDLGWFFCGT